MNSQNLPPGGPPPHVEDNGTDTSNIHNSIFFAAVSTTRMPMVITDPRQEDNPIIFANPAFINMTGYDKDELVGHNCRLLQGPETDQETVSRVRTAIEERAVISVEMLNYKKDGSSFWNALFISPVFDLDNNLIYFFASQLDVSRRRDVEHALYQSQKMEAVGLLTGGIAHDFNNLLTVIQGYAEMLQVNLENDPIDKQRALRAINAVVQATDKGSILTSQLLAFARKQKLQDRVINIQRMVDRIMPLIERSIGEQIIVKVNHLGKHRTTRIDPVQAEMAILNVAVNAKDAMNGEGHLTLTTDWCEIDSSTTIFGHVPYGPYIHLKISDTGSGIPPEIIEKITEPFFTTKEEGKGTGLGLSMVYGFVKQSEGILKIESTVGKGTTIHMLFKAEEAEGEKPVDVKAQRHLVGRQGDKETILVVEDKVEVADYVKEILLQFGYTVISASNADDALAIFCEDQSADLLFSDISMPGSMNGIMLAREALKIKPSLKVLLTTGYVDASVPITDNHGVAFEVLNKPHHLATLIEKVRSMLDGPDGVS